MVLSGSIILRVLTLVSVTLAITFVHYALDSGEAFLHIALRELYFIPIIVAGFWYGLKGALATAILISLLYFPAAVGQMNNFGEHQFGNLLQILLFNLIGALVGWLQDRELNRQAEKAQEDALVKTGKAVACIAHDMKTPLMAIGGFARQLRKSFDTNSKVNKKLKIIIHQTRRLEKMVQDMLRFAKPLELECETNDLNHFLDETLQLIEEKALLHHVNVTIEKSNYLPCWTFDYHRLQRALLNLVANAVEASPPHRKVILRCNCINENQSILFEIEDFGDGLKDMDDNDMFEPFTTNKKEGTGLGLPIVSKIVEAHGGTLEFEQKADRGMIFRMVLGFDPGPVHDMNRSFGLDKNP